MKRMPFVLAFSLATVMALATGPAGAAVTSSTSYDIPAATATPAFACTDIGCGPGIALAELLRAYPAARVIGADPSAVVLTSARRRNACALGDGRVSGRKRYPA